MIWYIESLRLLIPKYITVIRFDRQKPNLHQRLLVVYQNNYLTRLAKIPKKVYQPLRRLLIEFFYFSYNSSYLFSHINIFGGKKKTSDYFDRNRKRAILISPSRLISIIWSQLSPLIHQCKRKYQLFQISNHKLIFVLSDLNLLLKRITL